MRLIDEYKENDKIVYVYEEGMYEFEYWEKRGKIIGPRIGDKNIDEVSESVVLEAMKIYPNPKDKIRFTPIETRLL